MTDEDAGPVAAEIRRRLEHALAPTRLTLRNDSDQHAGHAGHDGSGESHFSLVIESEAFAGCNRVQRQRLVYKALGELMQGRVHALQIQASAPGEP
ncbi:MAG: BolA family transcriptional regulator [Planctomycetes bacterium]|nr:BolA family transcriptional regulator [Planctomycetota bacterium]